MSADHRLAAHVGLVEEPGPDVRVHVADLRTGPIITLPGASGLILLLALRLPAAQVPAEVAELTGEDVSTVKSHVLAHLDRLVAEGVIEPA